MELPAWASALEEKSWKDGISLDVSPFQDNDSEDDLGLSRWWKWSGGDD